MKEKINEEYGIHIAFCLHLLCLNVAKKEIAYGHAEAAYCTLLSSDAPSTHTTKKSDICKVSKRYNFPCRQDVSNPSPLTVCVMNTGAKREKSIPSRIQFYLSHCLPSIPGYDLPNRPRPSRVLLCQQSAGTLRRHGCLQGPARATVTSAVETPRLPPGCCQGSYDR